MPSSRPTAWFLRQIVPNATADEAVSIFAGEFRAIRRVARMWRTVCITFRVIVGTVMTGACPLPPEEVSAECPYLRLSAWRVLLQTATQGLTEFH